MKQIGFQKVYKWNTSLGLIQTSFTTEPVVVTARSTSSSTTTSYNTVVSTPYTTFTTTFSTGYSNSTSHSTTTTWATAVNTTHTVSTTRNTTESYSRSTSRSTAYNTSRSTAYTTSYTNSRSTSRGTSRGTSYSTSRSTSYSTGVSVSTSRSTSYTTSYTETYSTAVSQSTSRTTSRSTTSGGGGGGPGGGGFFCVVEGTLVNISASEAVPVETLAIGNTLLSKAGAFNTDDEQEMHDFRERALDGEATTTTLVGLNKHKKTNIIDINNGLLRATSDHLMLVRTTYGEEGRTRRWRIRPLYFCYIGDHFMDVNGEWIEIVSSEELTGEFDVWEIDTEPADVFYAGGILNHNHQIKE
ncbi:MAG: hypothetical protein ACKVJK_07075 [Methylophagaceae bacterium]|tara:strand:+ start:63 stop:1130 length:1068 start_codon:yes stop_codon:yes gene_type:complete